MIHILPQALSHVLILCQMIAFFKSYLHFRNRHSIIKDPENLANLKMSVPSCEICDQKHDLKFCEGCGSYWCGSDTCWRTVKKHRESQQGVGVRIHEKSDPGIVRRVMESMAAPKSEEEERQQHENDEDTLWLGWDKDENGDPLLAEYSRYASMMMETSQGRAETRYPALVSFVGQTGKTMMVYGQETHY